ncbi:myosin-10-like isoform X2 [Trichogramma pretiosum]|uniref:myosin-10-like isoform X2 n=1 Tax=Trichogramma pretiosum TaxID=7493 RepID=UPI000C71A307|nr:myosin-10-like isoform X2 [Trichogramma pretiosum]
MSKMSGSRLARGRASRMAILMVSVVLICCGYYVYRQTRAEMDKLRELHTKCNQQLDTLQAQLQVIYEYKVQLEKTLSNEKSANAAVKEELQLKASRERSMRDKDMVEAQQRYKSLQQQYKILQTGHKDLKDDCEKKAKVAYENTNICETKLVDLRKLLKKEKDEKDDLSKSLDHLKNKCMDEGQKKEQLEEQYENLVKTNQNDNGELARLQKQVIQLTRELDKYNKNNVGNPDIDNGQILPRYSNSDINDVNPANNLVVEEKSNPAAIDKDQMQMNRPSSSSSQHQAQVSGMMNNAVPAPLKSPTESSSKATTATTTTAKVKLPVGVPPIPRLIEQPKEDIERRPAGKADSEAQVDPGFADPNRDHANANRDIRKAIHQLEAMKKLRHEAVGHDPENGWYRVVKVGQQEVGEMRQEKSGLENVAGNEDVEQYDDYNYKETHNKNGDLHLEEGEDEREDLL